MKINWQKGMSLTEVMIAVGLAGGIALIVTQIMQNQSNFTKTGEIKSEYDNVVSDIRNILSSKESCGTTFVGRDVNVPAQGNVPNIKYVFNVAKPPIDKFPTGVKLPGSGTVTIERYLFESSDPTDSTVGIPANSVNGQINLKVYFRFDQRKKGGQQVVRKIKLSVVTQSLADRRIKECIANASFTSSDNRYLKKTGGTMKGDIIMLEGTQIVFESDRNLKENIQALRNIVPRLRKVAPVSYQWGGQETRSFGFVAQDFSSVFPELVHLQEESDRLAIDYVQMTPLLLAGIKEVHDENENLKKEIQRLREDHQKLKDMICARTTGPSFCGGHK